MDQLEATDRLPAVGRPKRPRRAAVSAGRGRRGPVLRVLGAVGVAVIVVMALWAVDSRAQSGKVARNVTLGGRAISGLRQAAVPGAVDELARRFEAAPVLVDAPGGGFQAGATELGLSVVHDRTATAAMRVGRTGPAPRRFWGWARSFVVKRPAPVVVAVDERAVAKVVVERDPARTAPLEPSLTVKDDHVVPEAGRPGLGISPPAVGAALRKAGPRGLPLRVSVTRTALPPRFTVDDAKPLADRAEQASAAGLPVTAGTAAATVPASTLRGWFKIAPADDGLHLTVDASNAPAALAPLFPNNVVSPVDAGFTVSGGKVAITPSKTGTACCGPEATTVLQSAVLNRGPGAAPVALPLKTVAPKRDDDAARKLGVIEPIGTFTTNHAPGEPRVHNIHRIADIVQGAVIEPGATFSVNDLVGRRTTANGFVDAPVIDEHYNFSSDVGGGISQFATTIFNAAFFSGLDIPSYFMHGIYISRYPYGRESTISFPGPDVRIRDNTPYGVLIWPTYTDTSITVTMYSTKWVSGDQTGQTTTPKGPCTAVTTERTRTYVSDGHRTVDHFSGLYSPAEGVECT